MSELDDATRRSRVDPDGAYERIYGLPEQCRDAWAACRDLSLPQDYREVDKVLIAGMGGSAIIGDLLQTLTLQTSKRPITVLRGYHLPGWVDGKTLVVASSHSGNTEETISAFKAALATQAKSIVITTGGRLGEIARQAGVPTLSYAYAAEPRSAIGHLYLRLLAIGRSIGILDLPEDTLLVAVAEMDALRRTIEAGVPEQSNPAKVIARELFGCLPLVVGAGFLAPVARRWRSQINENADQLAFWDELPELDHNLVVGLQPGSSIVKGAHAIFLDHESLPYRVRRRYVATSDLVRKAGASFDRLVMTQTDRLAAQLCAIQFGDFVSFYLAMLNEVRPTETENLDWLKAEMGK